MILLQLLCVVAPAFAVGGPQQLLGAPTQVTNLSAEQQDIVNFAFSQLSAGTSDCKKKVLRVNNFTKQVVAGMLYKFNLVLGSHEDNDASCPAFNPSGESCKMVVWVKPWEDFKEVSWDQVTCTKDEEQPEHLPLDLENIPLAGGIQQVDELSAEHQDIVKFGMAQLTGTLAAGCSKKMVSVENFGTQVVAGTLYHFDVVLRNKGCGAKDGKDERCKLVVYEVPWQGIKEVQWDKSTCGQ